jgi:hypothetical protein
VFEEVHIMLPLTPVVVDFQGTVSGKGSHIDLKIDKGRYKPVASPRTISRLSDGARTVYLRAVDKEGHLVDLVYRRTGRLPSSLTGGLLGAFEARLLQLCT